MENTQQEQLKNIVIAEKPDMNFKAYNETLIRVLSQEDETYLDSKYDEIMDFMRNKHSKTYSDGEKEAVYKQLQILWNEVSGKNGGRLNSISFDFILHQEEYKFVNEMLNSKLEYDVDTIFYAIELKDMLDNMKENGNYDSADQAIGFKMNAVDLQYLYHLLSKQTFKGLTKRTYTFAEVIKRIALSSNIFGYYKNKYEDLAKAIQFWVNTLEKDVNINKNDKMYHLIWGEADVEPSVAETTESK